MEPSSSSTSIAADFTRTAGSFCSCFTQSLTNIPNGINALQHHEVLHNATLKPNAVLGHITIQTFVVAAVVVAVSLIAFGALMSTLLGITAAIITFATRTATHDPRGTVEPRTQFWDREDDFSENLGHLMYDLMFWSGSCSDRYLPQAVQHRRQEIERPWYPQNNLPNSESSSIPSNSLSRSESSPNPSSQEGSLPSNLSEPTRAPEGEPGPGPDQQQ